ncbi:MAG TPA: methylthioribulose 1-phosphate dehydratase [Pseudomonadales bacterium]|nr:methylthioribulose 1-phosphate dehydratase [Pseudomonadales bacterium]
MFDHDLFERCAEHIIAASHDIYSRGWSPATSSNYSVRINEHCCAITVSGKHKGELGLRDVMAVDLHGNPLMDKKPSAETLLHTRLYAREPAVGAVLHTHSLRATVLTMELAAMDTLVLRGYELLKAFNGVTTHDTEVRIPVFDNTQDIAKLSQDVEERMRREGTGIAYLIRGHGLYTWAEDLAACMRHLEALEFLLDCEWQRYSVHGKKI